MKRARPWWARCAVVVAGASLAYLLLLIVLQQQSQVAPAASRDPFVDAPAMLPVSKGEPNLDPTSGARDFNEPLLRVQTDSTARTSVMAQALGSMRN